MIQRGEGLVFAPEAGQPLGIERERLGGIFNATPWLSLRLRARYTSPMPLRRAAPETPLSSKKRTACS
jgi:hypothetical protein